LSKYKVGKELKMKQMHMKKIVLGNIFKGSDAKRERERGERVSEWEWERERNCVFEKREGVDVCVCD
jgi:hypothetical protein